MDIPILDEQTGEPAIQLHRPPFNNLHRSHLHLEFDWSNLREYHHVAELQFVAGTDACSTLRERAERLLAERMRSCLHSPWQQRAV